MSKRKRRYVIWSIVTVLLLGFGLKLTSARIPVEFPSDL